MRKKIIKKIIDEVKPESYLEIGMKPSKFFNSLKINKKVNADSAFCIDKEESFDLIFINPHSYVVAIEQIKTLLPVLFDNGLIVVKNINPFPYSKEARQVPKPNSIKLSGGSYVGDTWKTIFRIGNYEKNLNVEVIEDDSGYLFIWKCEEDRDISNKKIPSNLPDKTEFLFNNLKGVLEHYQNSKLKDY